MPPFDPPLSASEIAAAFPARYSTVAGLKSGGQGSVFKVAAHQHPHVEAGATLALKIYFTDQMEERTQREIAALRALRHETLVALVDTAHVILRAQDCIWTETAFVDGECLAPMIARGPLSLRHIAVIACDIASAIQALWQQRIVHRDIKPDNIIVRPTGRAVLIDLGIARHVSLATLTGQGFVWGTQGYFSPEQYRGVHALTWKSDVYCLGVVIQEALLGRHPTARQQRQLVAGGVPTSALINGLPNGFASLIDRMLDRDPLRRPSPPDLIMKLLPYTA